jgi:signal transduction histidine kinase
MESSLAQFAAILLLAALYLPLVIFAMQRRDDGQGTATWLVSLYALLAMVLNITEAFWRNGQTNINGLVEFQIYGALTLIALTMLTLQAFLKRDMWWTWIGLWAFWMLGLALFLTNAFNFPNVLWTNGNLSLQSERLSPAWAILGWLVFAICLTVVVSNASRQSRVQLLRNRTNYWWLVFLFVFINDILIFSNFPLLGNPIRLFATATMIYLVVTHDLPDLRHIVRRLFTFALIAVVIVGLYVAGFLLIQALFRDANNFNPLIAGALIALVLALIFAPLYGLISRGINTWMRADRYDASRTIHQYSESISNILDMDKLSSIAVGIILEAMQIERGYLFLVDSEPDADGYKLYKLRLARSPEERQIVAAELHETGPVASYFIREQRPLLQYDLDLLPAFRNASAFEREWFNQLQAEVYIPIFAKKQWIGLIAFGAKMSGNRYTKEDLVTLSAHANQTAVALENARLVDNLMRLNNELRNARRQLEKNNRDLERIDQAKSDFISIASHELRTPLTVIKGYTEMLIEDPSLNENMKLMLNGIHEGTIRLHEVMDSMFDIAQIDARSLKPHLQPVELGHLIHEICIEQSDSIKERKHTVQVDIPSLPQVKADPNLLRKLFQHLLRNAVKFTPNNGTIKVAGRVIPPIIDLPNGGVEILFSDSGVGVDPNFRELIFTKFYQPGELGKHSTSKTRFKGGGAGLGLALSKGIVEAHGGRIWVESPGYDEINFPGSQFHVLLPLTKLETGEEQKASEAVRFQM